MQGGPLSPLLANIYLDELDKELEKRGHRFARYADDLICICKSRRAAERTLASLTGFVQDKMLLKVNQEKSHVSLVTSSRTKFAHSRINAPGNPKIMHQPGHESFLFLY